MSNYENHCARRKDYVLNRNTILTVAYNDVIWIVKLYRSHLNDFRQHHIFSETRFVKDVFMKKSITAFGITSLFFSSAYAAIEGETSTITFEGKIVEVTCSVDNSSDGILVDLGTIAANSFSAENDTSLGQDFAIQLKDCSPGAYQQAKVTFRGETARSSSTELKVTGGATNLGLQILEAGTPVAIDGSGSSDPKTLAPGTNIFDFTARYIALDSVVDAGDANSTVNFTVEYQ